MSYLYQIATESTQPMDPQRMVRRGRSSVPRTGDARA